MNKTAFIILLVLMPFLLPAQSNKNKFSLHDAIERSQKSSISSIRARHKFLVGYWRFRYFRADYLPYISLNTTPVNFNRTVTQRFDVNKNIDVYLPQRNVQSNANLSLYQKIGLTGGSVFLDSDIGRLQNFGDNPFSNYSVTPLRLGFIQPLFGFNEQKWEKVLEPMAFELAKKNYIADMEEVSMQALVLFFDLANAQNDYNLAISNAEIADTLLRIAKERLALGTLTQDDVLELELRLLDAEATRDNASIAAMKSESNLRIFLDLPAERKMELSLPEELLKFKIEPEIALSLALKNHPEIVKGGYDKLFADQEADRTNKENRFNAEISASIGLNQSSENIPTALGNLLDQEQIRVSLNIPILDWGRRDGRAKMAESQREVVYAEVQQARTDFEQEVEIQVATYLMQPQQVENAKKSKDLAQKRYEITRQRFLLGNVDLMKLTTAIQAQNQARKQYVQALKNFWISYHSIRRLTLFDFEKGQNIELDQKGLLK